MHRNLLPAMLGLLASTACSTAGSPAVTPVRAATSSAVSNAPCGESARLFNAAFLQQLESGDVHPELVRERRVASPSEIVTAQIDGFVSITGMQSDGPDNYAERFGFRDGIGIDVFVTRVSCSTEKPSEPHLACHAETEKQGTREAIMRHASLFQLGVRLDSCGANDMLRGVYLGKETFALSHSADGAFAESIFIARSGYEWFIRVNHVPRATDSAALQALSERVKALIAVQQEQMAFDAHRAK